MDLLDIKGHSQLLNRGLTWTLLFSLWKKFTWTLLFSLWKKFTSTWNQSTSRNPPPSWHCFAWFLIAYWETCFWVLLYLGQPASRQIINTRGRPRSIIQEPLLRIFAPIATAHRYCARKFTRHVMDWTRALRNKINNDRKDSIATTLRGFNDLGHSVTPTFLSRNRFYLQRSTHCPKMNKNWAWEVLKNFKISVHGTSNRAILWQQGAWNYGR